MVDGIGVTFGEAVAECDGDGVDGTRPQPLRGDTDEDGMKEILDAWGEPIVFLRWAPGYVTNPWDATRASMLASASLILSRNDSALNPPKTTEWGAPIRAHASIAIGSSGTIPR